MKLGPSAHVDTFARDNLPPPEPMAGIPARGLRLSRISQRRRRTDRPHGRARLRRPYRADRPRPPAHLQGAHRLEQPARPRAGRGLRREAGQPRADPLRQQSRDDRVLARRDQGRRGRRQHHADAARRRTRQDRRQGRDRARALRHAHPRRTGRLRQGQPLPEDASIGFDGTANHDAELDRVALNKPVRFEAVRTGPRRRRAARLHLGHDRLAEGDDAFPSRSPDHRRRLRQERAATCGPTTSSSARRRSPSPSGSAASRCFRCASAPPRR